MSDAALPLLEVRSVSKRFVARSGLAGKIGSVRAVDDVSFAIARAETLALVGESGSGKSTLGRAILQLDPPSEGTVLFDGRPITGLGDRQMRPLRRRMQMIFQDPFASLNPRMTIRSILEEPFVVHGLARGRAELAREVARLLDAVRLPASAKDRTPRQFSGGQRQRISIARALALNPEFVVADEPVSALDVSIQAQILNLLKDLQRERRLSYLFIAHDLAVVRQIADRVAVMYLGRIVELAPCDALYAAPMHPYSRALLDASPIPDPEIEARRKRITLEGEVPSPLHPPPGCAFHGRCPRAQAICRTDRPMLTDKGGGHAVACHFPHL